MTDPIISREVSGNFGRYAIRQAGAVAEMSYTVTGPGRVQADHTEVPDSFRGTGAGIAMLTRMVADARAEGFKITPLCPFVQAMRLRHPEWADVFAP